MLYFLLALGCFGLLTSTVFAAMVLAAARHHLRQHEPGAGTSLPPVSLLKPLHGIEPDLARNLSTFFNQDRTGAPPFEILFCTRDADDPGLEIARRVAAQFPAVPARFLSTNGQPPYINAKVASLEKMTAAAAHEILIISDSDVRVSPGYLAATAGPFTDPAVGALTCLYRGVAAGGGLWARIEAIGMSVEMTAGVLVANMLEGMQFALGPTMAVRRECVHRMGGMGSFGDYCSDDYILGNEVFKQGRKVVLSHHVIDHIVINLSLLQSLRHQVRWMKSTRFSRPKGHLGTSLTFSMPFALLALFSSLALHLPTLAALLFGWGLITRWAIAWAAGAKVVQDPSTVGLYILYPIRDLMGFFFWCASYTSPTILWRGRILRLVEGGRMESVP